MMRWSLNKIIPFLICILAASCSGIRHLPEGEKLYTGTKIKLESSEKIKNKKAIVNAAESAVRPKPNKMFLGMRPKLWLFQIAGDTTGKKGFRKWLKKQGEPPVFLSSVNASQTAKFMDAKLFNIGIFKNLTSYKTIEKKKTARIDYTCFVHPAFKIKEIKFPDDDDLLSELISSNGK